MWGELTYPFPNFNSAVEVWEWIRNSLGMWLLIYVCIKDNQYQGHLEVMYWAMKVFFFFLSKQSPNSWISQVTSFSNTPNQFIQRSLTPSPLNNWVIILQNVILFSDVVNHKCNILIWNWSYTMHISSALWILVAWCFSTRASVATVLTTHPCVSRCLLVKQWSDQWT